MSAQAVSPLMPSPVPSSVKYKSNGAIGKESWDFPLEENTLIDFFTDVFENHWQGLRFGPIIQGAAYEMKPPSAPKRVTYSGSYLTVMYHDGGHFHLCLGDYTGSAANPFLADDDSLPEVPDFSRLAAWRSISKRWLGRDAEILDEQGKGFRH